MVASFWIATDLAADEFGFAFFDESSRCFLVILGAAGKRLAKRFAIEVCREVGGNAALRLASSSRKRFATARDAVGDGLDFLHQGRRGNDAINQTDVERFVRTDHIRQKVEFPRFRGSDELSERVGTAEVAGKSDLGEGGAEASVVSRDAEIARQRKAQSGSGCGSVDGSDGDFRVSCRS